MDPDAWENRWWSVFVSHWWRLEFALNVKKNQEEDRTQPFGRKDVKILKIILTFGEKYLEPSLSKDGLRKDGLSKDGLSKDGLSEDELSKDGLSKVGFSNDGLSKDGLNNLSKSYRQWQLLLHNW